MIQRILELLDQKSLKAVNLCRYIGINTSTMANRKNRGTDPHTRFMIPICEFWGVSCEFFWTGKDSPNAFVVSEGAEWLSLIHRLPEKTQ